MSLESDIAVLASVPLFAGLDGDQLRLLAFGAEHRRLRRGETLFRMAARSDAGFVVVTGEVELLRQKGETQISAGVYGPGTLLGEFALLTETRRPATAVTRTDCDFIRIARPLFRRMLEEYPEIARKLHERIADDLARMTADILSLEDAFRG
ncbi:cyclic nucleotide-binding domain-containing protein [Aureimonas leprariae]|uniref:Cyclic nucleotide-binding domain-containing protein n=1 Tax=Plantimonas leprariae TaxID=2615207 RepID=A0A7V7TXT4_9HYPH|nr:cyclic nucleotide-binding domain-containing protein [Aureimonas leprariae]KAB0681445.1 cyclic nucleotide-binding domain-containing protein [Aureimonas leprariae]